MRSPQAPSRPRGPGRRKRFDPDALLAAVKWSPAQQAKIEKVMGEFKDGTLDNGHGGRVTSRKQALAIAMSKAREITASGRFDRPVLAAGWDESKHPRDPGGEGGGQWTDKGEGAADEGPGPNEVSQENASNPEDDLETRAQHYVSQGYQPIDGEPDEWITMEHPETKHQITLDVNDEYDGQVALEEGAMGAEEDDGEVDPHATDYDEAGGDEVQNADINDRAEQIAENLVDKIAESMDHAGEEEGYSDEASQGRGYDSQLDEEIAMGMEYYFDDEIGDMGISDEEYDRLSGLVEKKLRKKMLGEQASGALTASAAGLTPEVPPKAWFEKPKLDGPTAMTVTADGQVYGHAALWGTCHTGMPGVCRTPPRSESGYRYFHLGEVDTDGGRVHVGRVTMDTGHAPLTASKDGAVRHYDDTGTGIAHVRAYEDEHGIVLAGALAPGVQADKAKRFRGATVSGDWRSIGGKLEMVGMLAVNVPGFPVPRAMAASLMVEDEPHTMALVAAGVYRNAYEDEGKLKALTARALGGLDGLAAAAGYKSKARRRMGVTAAVPGPAPSVES